MKLKKAINLKRHLIDFFKSHIFISILGSFLGIFSTAIFFILLSRYLDHIYLAKFSLALLFFFATQQISLIGIDQNIIANTKYLKSKIIIIDNKIFLLIYSILFSILIFTLIYFVRKIFVIELNLPDFVILNISVILSLMNRTFQGYLQSCSKLFANAWVNFTRYLGYMIFIFIWFLKKELNILFFFLFSELFAFLIIVLITFFIIGFEYSNKKIPYNLKYTYLGFSQFSYESMFKLDLLTISIFGNQKILIYYTILSNVLEGVINFVSVSHPMIHNFMNKFKSNEVQDEDIKLMNYINYFSIFILILIVPFYLFFNYLVFLEFVKTDYLLIALIFSSLLIFFRKVFLFYYFFSINNDPLAQLYFSMMMLIFNLSLNILLFKTIGIWGIAVATLLTYFVSNIYINKYIIKYRDILKFI